jgi:cytochrome c oxidase subunit 2
MIASSFWLPERVSTVAADVDWNFHFVYWVCVFFFALITFLLVLFVVRYRNRPAEETADHNTPLELLWSAIPTAIVMVMFWFGYATFMAMAVAPQDAYEIGVTAQKWSWLFTYPNGYVDGELHVPIDEPVRLVMSSEDVIHSFFVPQLRVKRDVIPGRYTDVWFQAMKTGEFRIYCTEYCGTSHYDMLSKLHVHDRAGFEAWLEEASDFLSRMPPAEAGEMLYLQRGCKQCHSVDGTTGTAPTFLGLYGTTEPLAGGGSAAVDENYVRESIVNPHVKIRDGYEPVMPSYQGRLSDAEISAIIEYLKTLSKKDS